MKSFDESYLTIRKPSEGLYKEKGSKFLSYAIPTRSVEQAKSEISELRTLHPKAVHVCFAWRIGTKPYEDRFSDDGEPNNSAGKPIFGQIVKAELVNVLIAVVRYYGGTKLGVGGLISAYKTAAELAIENGKIVRNFQMTKIKISFNAEDTGDAMIHINRLGATILEHSANAKEHYVILEIKSNLGNVLLENLNKSGKFVTEIIE